MKSMGSHSRMLVVVCVIAGLAIFMGNQVWAQSDTPNAEAVVLVNSASAGYSQYEQHVQPYLGHFGVPCTVLDIFTTPVTADIEDFAVIIVGHRQLDADGLYLDVTEQGYVTAAASGGTGLVNFDNDLSADNSTPRYQYVDDIFGFGYTTPPSSSGITIASEGYLGHRIDCWDDAHQDPVLTTTEVVGDLVEDDGLWTEFLYLPVRDYPSILAAVDEDLLGLPVMRFHDSGIPNGDYQVMANLYTSSSGRDMRYFYGFSAGDPREFSVDTVGGAGGTDQHAEYNLGTVSVVDGTFEIFVQDAELLGGTYPFFGWAWIRLVEEGTGGELHYITERHSDGETISTGSMTMAGITLPPEVLPVAASGSSPFLSVTTSGLGRAVQWGSCDWMSNSVKGPVYNLDDLVWRSIVWAARKPFVMQGLPPFLTMRIDDWSGPFHWIDIANEFGIKPWAGLFFHNVDATEAAHLSTLVNAGLATSAIHAKSSVFFYYDHGVGDFPQATVDANFAEGTQWHLDHNIPISKFILPHYYEFGTNVFQGLSDWGVEFVGTQMDPGNGYGSPWVMNGPFRLFETGSSSEVRPQYYADFITVPGHPEFDGQFFNCVTEIRDDAGYEWYPSSDVQLSIDRGTRQSKRAMDGMALATLFTHGQHLVGIPLQSARDILEGITNNLQVYDPITVTLDHACQYVRAMHTSDIAASVYDPDTRALSTSLSGGADMPTMFYLFTEQGSTIQHTLVDVPLFSGSTAVAYTVPGPLDHVVVTPDTATLVTGASQTFTAQGFDAENNPIPNLDFSWSVVGGGGTINQGGVFTAGMTAGMYTDTVEAAIEAVSGHATVEVVEPTLDHFTVDPVGSPQYVGIAFSVSITARDLSNGVFTGYSGPATLTDTTGTMTPAVTGSFTAGVWTGQVTVSQAAAGVAMTVQDGAVTGTSNGFDVEAMPDFYQVTSSAYIHEAGQPFTVTVGSAYGGTTVNCWEDDHQDPVLATFYDPDLFVPDDDQWDEFHWSQRPYPAVFASQTENPPVMEFSAVVPNGPYHLVANLYRSNDFRYYYGFDGSTPRDFSVDVASGTVGEFTEFDLGTVTVTDNIFALYVDHADVIFDAGNFPYYGWAWIRLEPLVAESQVNCWEDDHQDPVLVTTESVGDLVEDDGLWTEFLHTPARDYPTIMAAEDEDLLGLPVMRFYASGIANGEYEILANLFVSSGGRDMRYFYGYTPGDPREFFVDTGGDGGTDQHTEYSLGTVSIVDGTFNLYVQDAELQSGTYPYFGWAWVRLVSTGVTMSSDSPMMLFDGDQDGTFGEAGDDTLPLVGGTFDITARGDAGGTDISIIATDIFGRSGSNLYTINSDETMSAAMTCVPASGTLPFTTQMTVTLENLYTGQTRSLAAHLDVLLAGGQSYSYWRAGYSNVAAGTSFTTAWNQHLPALGNLLGGNQFTLVAEDVTPAPYNQPPYPPAGDTATAMCTVTGSAP